MNRTFTTDFTPAKARLLLALARHTRIDLDPSIAEKAKEDLISDIDFARAGIDQDIDKRAIQFIFDTEMRAGLPTMTKDRAHAKVVLNAVLTIGGIASDEMLVVKGEETSFDGTIVGFDFEKLLPLRKKLLILHLDGLDRSVSAEMLGKMFPRIIIVGSMALQYAMSFGVTSSTTGQMGKILYPAVEDSFTRSKWKRGDRRSLVAMGVFPEYLEEFANSAKKLPLALCVPQNIEY
jgi:hypothetical protein